MILLTLTLVCLPAALHEARLDAELRDGGAAIHLDDFAFHAKGAQRVFDDVRLVAQIVFAQRGFCAADRKSSSILGSSHGCVLPMMRGG